MWGGMNYDNLMRVANRIPYDTKFLILADAAKSKGNMWRWLQKPSWYTQEEWKSRPAV